MGNAYVKVIRIGEARTAATHAATEDGQVAQGNKPAELIESYTRLTAEMIRLAAVYAAAYPLRGRPRKQPWRDQQPVRRGRRRLDAIALS